MRTISETHPFYGSPLRTPRVAMFFSGLLIIILIYSIFNFLFSIQSMGPETTTVFWQALGYSTLLSAVPVGILLYLDRRERESAWLILLAFLWGGLIATGLSMPVNGAILVEVAKAIEGSTLQQTLGPDAALLVGAPIAGPIVEETFKAIGVIALFCLMRAEFDNVRDGFIYGALVGVGFNWLESAMYVAQGHYAYGYAPWGLQLGGRYALLGMAGHALYTGIFGAFLGKSRQVQRWWRHLMPIIGLLLAMLAHFVNNALGIVVALQNAEAGMVPPTSAEIPPPMTFWEGFLARSVLSLILFAPFLILIGITLVRSGRWERAVIERELGEEDPAIITQEELAGTRNDKIFRTRRIEELDRRAGRQLVNAQNELAFRKNRVRQSGKNPDEDELVRDWRAYIRQLRATPEA